jgi:hypothetical protein
LKNKTPERHKGRRTAMKKIFDFRRLHGRIIEKFGSCEAFGRAVGLSKAQVSDRLNNKVAFKPDEIPLICSAEILDIKTEEIGTYFFTLKV